MKRKLVLVGLVFCSIGGYVLLTPLLYLAFPVDHEASEEAVKVRNSLLAVVGHKGDFDWTPNDVPANFLQEKSQAPEIFAAATKKILKNHSENHDAFSKALMLAEHLSSGPAPGGAIMSNTAQTYSTIITKGGGYCADYTQSFNALALSSGLAVREWGIAFEEFGAGHAFNEVYDPVERKWIFIDSFWSLYIRDIATGVPLSALEFLKVLEGKRSSDTIEFVPIVEGRYGFKSSNEALEYYRQAKDQFYLWGGNNVWTYDSHPIVSWFGKISRSAEQLIAITLGIHPNIIILPTDGNDELIDDVFSRRNDLLLRVSGTLILSLAFFAGLFYLYRDIRKSRA